MADMAASSSAPSKNDKPVIVRVKGKACQSRLEAFWLEINERPFKRSCLNFEKLSISKSDSSGKVEELKTKKVFVQHVEIVSSLEVTSDVLQSFVPKSVDGFGSKGENVERRHTFKTANHILGTDNSALSMQCYGRNKISCWLKPNKSKRFCQKMLVLNKYREAERGTKKDRMMVLCMKCVMSMTLFVLMLRKQPMKCKSRKSKNDYVYDVYAVKDDINIADEDASYPCPLVQVDDDDEFYDGPVESEYESDDSNAEDNPLNDYLDEGTSEDVEDGGSKTSNDESEELDSASACNISSEPKDLEHHNCS